MRFWKRSIRPDGHPYCASTKARGPSRRHRLQLENLEGRALLSTYTLSEIYYGLHQVPRVVETVNGVTTLHAGSPFVLNTGSGSNTVNILDTSADIDIEITGQGQDTVNVGSGGSVQGIVGDLYVESPSTTLNINASADAGYGSVTLSTYTPAGDSPWGSITGLAPGAINYRYSDISGPVHISTAVGSVSWNVSANAMASINPAGVSVVVVDDNGFAINPNDPAAATSYSPAPSNVPLWGSGGPSYLDVEQGGEPDCWVMAPLAEVAARAPQDIENMFTYDGTMVDNGATVGLYTVRLFDTSGSPVYLQVDTDLPSGGSQYAHVSNALGTSALWPALAEKAYAEANGLGLVTTNFEGQDSYDAMNGGDMAWVLQAITGHSASYDSINPTNIASAWNSGKLVVLYTTGKNPTSSYIEGGHCYAVVGYNPSSYPNQPFEVFNAWGTDSASATPSTPAWAPGHESTTIDPKYGLFWASPSFISQNFNGQNYDTGAIDVNDIDRALDELTELAALGGDYSPSGMIHSVRQGLTGGEHRYAQGTHG